jgi:hypothetical protein
MAVVGARTFVAGAMNATTTLATLFGCDPRTYHPHALHAHDRVYAETNCYMDVVIELLHARGDEPLAALGFLARMDFEGDQWTFFKPPPEDLEALFGVDIHEMQPYRPLPEQIEEQLWAGRTIIVELNAWYLPDTASTSYRSEHVKTSVAIEAIDRAGERLSYFHNRSLHELAGADYRGVFGLDPPPTQTMLPPYTELVRFDSGQRLAGDDLRAAARALLRRHLQRRPVRNPFAAFGERLTADLPALVEGDPATYHAYAFATARMAGAAFELFAAHLEWLFGASAAPAVEPLQEIVIGCTTLSLKLARRRQFDVSPACAALADAWERAFVAADALV